MAFESSFKAIDNTLHHDDGCSTALDYVEQSSWVLFLKYFDDLEKIREQAAELEEKPYERIIDGEYRWNQWAVSQDLVWYYQLDKHFTKTNPLTDADLEDFLALQKTKADSENSWTLDATALGEEFDLSVKNPHKVEEVDERSAKEILDNIADLNAQAKCIIDNLRIID